MIGKIQSRQRHQKSRLTISKARRRPSLENLEDRRLLATYQVTNTDGTGPGSLRAAIMDANSSPGPDRITFDQSLKGETIQIRTALPNINEEVSIEGPTGPRGLLDGITIDADGGAFSVIKIVQGAENVKLSNLTLTGGNVSSNYGTVGTEGYGGGLWNIGQDTTLDHVEITGNQAQRGGGIYSGVSELIINNSSITDNTATASEGDVYGGGIYSHASRVEIHDSEIANNVAHVRAFTAFGGGIASDAGGVELYDTTVRDNKAGNERDTGHGGGFAGVNYGDISPTTSAIYDNHAYGDGGGIYLDSADAYVNGSTIVNNTAEGVGGGLVVLGLRSPIATSDVALTGATIVGNTATDGAGIHIGLIQTTADIVNSVIAQNADVNGREIDVNNFLNVIRNDSSWIGTRDGNPLLKPLGDHGGPTWSRVPLPNSPLIDAGTVTYGLEQRGQTRIADGNRDGIAAIDMGATEFIPKAQVSGQVVRDLNADDVRDVDEPGLDGWTVSLYETGGADPIAQTITFSVDLDSNGIIEPATESGHYELTDIDPGDYEVRELVEPGFSTNSASYFLTLNDEIVEDIDFLNHSALQQVFGADDELVVPVPGGSIHVPVQYSTSDGNKSTTGIGVRMHFDSSWLTYGSLVNNAPSLFQSEQLIADTADYDNDPLTDSFLLISYIDTDALFPDEENFPLTLFDSYFTPTRFAEAGQTTIRFTAASHDARYGFSGEDIDVSFVEASLDVDGNGTADALTDGLLMSRYLLGATGDALVEYALAPNATRTDPQEIVDYLDVLQDTMLDPNGDGLTTAFGDGVILSRYLLGYRDTQLISVTTPASTRTTGQAVADYLEDFHPNRQSQGSQIAAEGEQIENIGTVVNFARTDTTIPPVQSVSLDAVPGPSADSVRFEVGYQTNAEDVPTPGLATRLHYDSDKLDLVETNHFADHHVLDQVFLDADDWDNDPETDRYLLTGFVDADGDWEVQDSDQTVSAIDFLVRDTGMGPTSVNLTPVESPTGWGFEGRGSRLGLSHTNKAISQDVNHDGRVTALDALIVINQLDREDNDLPAINLSSQSVDVNDDNKVSAMDALIVINTLDLLNRE